MEKETKKVNYKDMFLESPSGFSMPFELKDEEELHVTLPYGEQTHPKTGEKFTHLGVDLAVKDKNLWALASGTIIGAGENAIHGNYIVAKYGKYEVTYGHISEAYTPYGTVVEAGDTIAKAGDFLHLGVRFDGRDMDPMEFLKVIWGNIQQLAVMGIHNKKVDDTVQGRKIHTQYDAHQDELLMLMLRWLPEYMNELRNGSYAPQMGMETTLRNIFAQAARKDYFYEAIPSIANPLGLGGRAVPLIEKVQNLLIQDFLSYMFTRHSAVMPEMDDNQKKKFLARAAEDGMIVDPLAKLNINVQNYDVKRRASVYYDMGGTMCWTKAWFNDRERGERSVAIPLHLALQFAHDEISLDDWLARFYPKQMSVYQKVMTEARKQLLGM